MPVKPTAKMSLGEIRRKANAGALGETDIRRIFRVDDKAGKAFAPAIAFVRDAVDFTGFTEKPGEAAELLATAHDKRKRALAKAGPGVAKRLAKATGPKVLAEGDSWFNLPWLLWPKTAMDFLAETHDLANLAKWGDELAEMLDKKQYLVPLKSKKYRHFFLSGGGNDVLGDIGKYVSRRKSGDTDPANAATYVSAKFDARIKALVKDVDSIAQQASAAAKGVVVYIHGYADAVPVNGGKYLGKPLAALDFDPVAHGALARAIIADMVGRFNDALRDYASGRAGVVYVDLRPEVSATDWHDDEIHPSAAGAKKIARRFRDAIKVNTPVA